MSNRFFLRAVIAGTLCLSGMSLGCSTSPSAPTPPPALPAPVPVPVPVPVALQGVSLTSNPSVVTAGGQLGVSWVAPSGRSAWDWIGLFKVADPSTSYENGWWQYTNGAVSGTLTLSAPTQPGEYEFRYLVDDGFNEAARSTRVTVTPSAPSPPGVYTVTAGTNTVGPGGQLSVSWTTSNGGHNDWIVLLKNGDSNAGYSWWTGWTDGATSGTFTLNAPALAGQYEFRYLLDDGYDDAAVSSLVTVSASAGPTYNRSPQ